MFQFFDEPQFRLMNLLRLAFILACFTQLVATRDYKAFYRPLSIKNLKKLRYLEKNEDPTLYSGQYEGDIIISPEQMEYYKTRSFRRNGILDTKYQWRDKIVPYQFREDAFGPKKIKIIKLAMKEIEQVSCLKFVSYEPEDHRDFVTVQAEEPGCFSSVGRQGGEQIINLGSNGCFRRFTVVHEFLHTLGFFHMQSATNRDEYVEIMWDKIKTDTEQNFENFGSDIITSYDVDYDYGSVMHYPPKAFSIDDSETIIPLKELHGAIMGQRDKISEGDEAKLWKMYCNGISSDSDIESVDGSDGEATVEMESEDDLMRGSTT